MRRHEDLNSLALNLEQEAFDGALRAEEKVLASAAQQFGLGLGYVILDE